MTSYIKSKIQRSISFLIAMVIAFSVCSGVVLLNPSPSYAFRQADVDKVRRGEKTLVNANLSGANLTGANLNGAKLDGTWLALANLSGVNLNGAKLERASLKAANLEGVDLSVATLGEVDLSDAKINGSTKFPTGFTVRRADPYETLDGAGGAPPQPLYPGL